MPKRLTVEDRIRIAIEKCGKRRSVISRELGVSEAMLSRFVHGTRRLGLDMTDRLCAYLGLGYDGVPVDPPPPRPPLATEYVGPPEPRRGRRRAKR